MTHFAFLWGRIQFRDQLVRDMVFPPIMMMILVSKHCFSAIISCLEWFVVPFFPHNNLTLLYSPKDLEGFVIRIVFSTAVALGKLTALVDYLLLSFHKLQHLSSVLSCLFEKFLHVCPSIDTLYHLVWFYFAFPRLLVGLYTCLM